MKPRTYIGFSSTQHDPGIAVVDEQGNTLFAEALERSSKNKRAWNIVPDQIGMIEHCINEYVKTDSVKIGASWSQASLAWSPFVFGLTYVKSIWFPLVTRLFSKVPTSFLGGKLHRWSNTGFKVRENSFLRLAMYKAPSSLMNMFLNLEHRFRLKGISWSKQGVNHHLAHAYSGVCTSRYESATVVVLDGMGEGVSYAIYELKNNRLHKRSKDPILNMASLGLFYASICEACGFDPVKGEEWKVMGLAPYGRLDTELYKLLKGCLSVKGLNLIRSKHYSTIMNEVFNLSETFSCPMDAKDLAFTAQQVFEETMSSYLRSVFQTYPNKNLILSGGCALNSSANGKILDTTPFESLHIAMSPGDDGNALGAAVKLWHDDHPNEPIPRTVTPYLGSTLSTSKLELLVRYSSLKSQKFDSDDALCREVAHRLSEGDIVAWVQGRAEFGARALGNRSIIADPRNEKIKEIINAKVKFREEFRPFAPSILSDFVPEYFENPQESLYMERTLKFKKFDAPGVVHFNNTGRLQSVTKALNPKFYHLIEAFYDLTKVPILLNTSFNVMGRPIVHDMEDAIGVFMISGIDLLVIENTIFYK